MRSQVRTSIKSNGFISIAFTAQALRLLMWIPASVLQLHWAAFVDRGMYCIYQSNDQRNGMHSLTNEALSISSCLLHQRKLFSRPICVFLS